MSLMKQEKPTEPSELLQLKQRYAKLARALEQTRQQWLSSEKLLCVSSMRVNKAFQGLDNEIDPLLAKINALLQNKLDNQGVIETPLNVLIEELLRIRNINDKSTIRQRINLLFDYLEQSWLVAEKNQSDKLLSIQKKALSGAYETNQLLYQAINELLFTQEKDLPEHLNNSDALQPEKIDIFTTRSQVSTVLQDHLLELLKSSPIPPALLAKQQLLIEELESPHVEVNLLPLLNECIVFMKRLIEAYGLEQQALEFFLGQLTENLEILELQALDTVHSQHDAADRRIVHNTTLTDQVEKLTEESRNANDLKQLKIHINDRVQQLSQQLSQHREFELEQRQQMNQSMQLLTDRIKMLEQETQELKKQLHQTHLQAIHDELTSVHNRLAMNEVIPSLISRCHIEEKNLTALIWDIDFFKEVNDRFGHAAGDKVLQVVAQTLKNNITDADFLGRLGGEEFVMLLPDKTASQALLVAEEIRQAVEQTGFNSGGKPLTITISCGITQCNNSDDQKSLIDRADQALYKAKKNGRNRCHIA